ncbi:tripartite tricarboxylate transporter substrate binding protein [Halanaerobium sp. MA284_MarDTE_T2]|uniref:Bug family tripartite tricarboxylate transporter substrate binding protein n=1 Tax=Halanaerobium sp. MA284_MarDTE_T2 TaxID=2183913 RepID=UPI000E118400|nr:tripartite tricarboxylate transporter substrate binding protein [Halanaerobium sp. MA284_MarDTE_T2]RCW44392.1 tripartite-type tricarboxylate transporter receptor subunit TctC [Halanaerobium sp. MA284_MarDTE_T2]
MRSKILVVALTLMVVIFFVGANVYAADYPNKDIKIVCPWDAGGGTDAINRQVAKMAEEHLPVSMYVENITGGVSGIGVYEVMSSIPDGYTIGSLTYDSIITVPRQNLVPGYSLDKLELICRVTQEADSLMVSGKSKWESFEEFIESAEKNPGELVIGIQGKGSRVHLTALRIQDLLGVEFNLISYPSGAGAQKEAVLSGEVDAVITSMGDFAPLIQSGQVRPLVSMGSGRNPQFNNVPTMNELGHELEMGSFVVFAAPEGTPEDRVKILEEAIHKAHQSEEFQTWLKQIGVVSSWMGRDEITDWASNMQEEYFSIMDELVEQGVIEQ